jgi:acyl carrier protein
VTPIGERVRSLIARELGISADRVIPHASLVEDLGANLLDRIEIVLALEETFEITIPYDRAMRIRTVLGFIRCVTDLAPRSGLWHPSRSWDGRVTFPTVDAARAPAHLLRNLSLPRDCD